MEEKPKITTGLNDRSRNDTIGQSAAGAPDDSGRPVEVDEAEEAAIRQKLQGSVQPGGRSGSDRAQNPDRVPPGTPGAGENICRRCSGTGEANGRPCPDCGGTGKVVTPVGGGG